MDAPFDEPTRQSPAERYYSGRKMFGGRFVLDRRLGRGGMGEVWLAVDGELGREVALKFAPSEVAGDPKCVAELRREVIAGLELSHPRIARVYDLQTGDGEAAISMEYVRGKSLSDLQAETAHGFFEPREIEGWIGDVKDALRYAHEEAKRTHRDVKPKNIMVDAKTGRAKLVDFGISKRISETFTRTTGTDSSGSLAYMSPQQMLGARNSAEDDWYSLGATVYELVTGAPPFFRGDVRAQIERVVPPPMGERRKELVGELIDGEGDPIPAGWEDWVARMLSKERGRMEGAAAKVVEVPPLPGKTEVVSPEVPKQEAPMLSEPSVAEKPPEGAGETEMPGRMQSAGQEAGIFGEAPKESEARDLRLMSWRDGLLWAGVVALLFMGGMLATFGFDEMLSTGWMTRILTCQFLQGMLLASWVGWFFRRHGNDVSKLVGTLAAGTCLVTVVFYIVSAVLSAVDSHVVYVTVGLVAAFVFPVVLVFLLNLGMGWAWKIRLRKLDVGGIVSAVFWVPIVFIFRSEPGGLLSLGALLVGLVFGFLSAWALVSSRKVRV